MSEIRKQRGMSSTFQVSGEQNLNEEPEEEQQYDAFNHSLTEERDDRLPQQLVSVLLLLLLLSVGHHVAEVSGLLLVSDYLWEGGRLAFYMNFS